MRVEYRVVEGGLLNAEGMVPTYSGNVHPDTVPRCNKEPWIRISRLTFDDEGRPLKTELGVFAARGGDIEIRWKEYRAGAVLTDIAPMSEYLVWEKKE
jgi:hypothetical protein